MFVDSYKIILINKFIEIVNTDLKSIEVCTINTHYHLSTHKVYTKDSDTCLFLK